jgi:hypothetical protein
MQMENVELEYVDAAFELLTRQVESAVNAVDLQNLETRTQQLNDLCKIVRKARIEFDRIVRSYGADYEDQGTSFVDLVEYAANLAVQTDCDDVKKSLRKHADHVASAQMEMKAAR